MNHKDQHLPDEPPIKPTHMKRRVDGQINYTNGVIHSSICEIAHQPQQLNTILRVLIFGIKIAYSRSRVCSNFNIYHTTSCVIWHISWGNTATLYTSTLSSLFACVYEPWSLGSTRHIFTIGRCAMRHALAGRQFLLKHICTHICEFIRIGSNALWNIVVKLNNENPRRKIVDANGLVVL